MPLSRPPLLTLLQEELGWTLDRSADLAKGHRFTFGQRLDGLTLDALLLVQRGAVTGDRALKAKHLGELSVLGKGFLSEGRRFRCDARRVPPAAPGPRVQPNRCPRARGLSGKRRGAGRGR